MPKRNTSSIPIGIKGIVIENFRGISLLQLEFLDAANGASDIVVFGGPNGSGKTAVLEACLLAMGYSKLLQGPSGPPAVRTGAPGYRISARFQTPHGDYRSTWWQTGEASWRNETKNQQSAPVHVPCMYFSSWRAPRLVGAVPITAGRRGKRPSDREENRLWLTKQYLVNAKAHAFMRVRTPHPAGFDTPYQAAVETLNQVWQMFHPGRNHHFTVEPLSDDPESGFDVFLVGPHEAYVPLDSLSSGQLELVALFGSFLRAKFEEGIVVIDEPELHLDPQWHTLMLRALRKFLPKAQFIVATHSPEVYDSVYSFQRRLLLPPEDPRAIAWKTERSGVAE